MRRASLLYEAHIEDREQKAYAIDPDFFRTPAMNAEDWKGPNFELRHVFTRTAAHGFHHRVCDQRGYHQASTQCSCRLCSQHCPTRLSPNCMPLFKETHSMNFYANDENFQ
ncbi:hypothetical protein ANN_10335 [Periplaneta americana]|uniref:Uncharacterized protein n=1 Tax=Periplaneta americana TaxID=6978 RepID=A0ABQ8TSL9_PERAM|nr:hypothetical protein ANN_10335 [Periplaneta americana]